VTGDLLYVGPRKRVRGAARRPELTATVEGDLTRHSLATRGPSPKRTSPLACASVLSPHWGQVATVAEKLLRLGSLLLYMNACWCLRPGYDIIVVWPQWSSERLRSEASRERHPVAMFSWGVGTRCQLRKGRD
jgi:hypothetical protein